MNDRRTAVTVFLVIFTLCVAHALYYYPQLPESVATHFGGSGEPDGWATRTGFLTTYLLTITISAAVILGLGAAIRKMPTWAINLPNRDYWLAPERRDETLSETFTWMIWMESLTLLFLLDIFHQMIRVSLGKATILEHFWVSMGAYTGLVIVWCVGLLLRFGSRQAQAGINS